MRILFVITKSEIGGAQRFVAEQIQIIAQTGQHEVFLATDQPGWLTQVSASFLTGLFTHEKITKRPSAVYFWKLLSYLRKQRIELIVCNSANGGLYGRLAAFFTKRKTIYVSHGWSSIYNGGPFSSLFNRLEQLLGYLGTSVLCVSSTDYRKAIEFIKLPPSKLKLLHNCIFPLNTERSIPKDRNHFFSIVTICRLVAPKRVDLLIKAVKSLPLVQLSIVGSGPQRTELEKLISPQFVDRIHFLGEIPAFHDFKSYDAFALISDSEGLPISALEAMSCGLPLVVSNVGGCVDVIDNNGVLVDNQVDSIRNGILDCIKNKERYAEGSFYLFDTRFNLLKNASLYLEYYQAIAHPSS